MKTISNQLGFAHPVAIGVVTLTLAVVGFTGYRVATSNDKDKLSSTEQRVKADDALPIDLNDVLEVSKIKDLAIGSSTASVSNIELENKNGQLVYKVRLSDGTVVVLNAKTGVRVAGANNTSEVEDDQDVLPADFTVAISFDEARKIAQAKFPNGKINKIELDVEDGKVVLSVRFTDKARVDVDANTGAIVRVKNPKDIKPKQGSVGQPVTPPNSSSGVSGSGRNDSNASNDDSPRTNTSGSDNVGGTSANDSDSSSNDSNSDDNNSPSSGSGSSGSDDDNKSDDDHDSNDDSNDDSDRSNSGRNR